MSSGNHLFDPNSNPQTAHHWQRRDFVKGVAALAGAAGLSGYEMRSAAAEPPPETSRIRLVRMPSICQAPQYVAEELFHAEGLAEVEYLKRPGATKAIEVALASGEADINMHFAGPTIMRIDAGDPVVMLSGAHVGCFELFATDRVRAIRDLKGKTVAVRELGSSQHVFLASMLAYVGLDPNRDVNLRAMRPAKPCSF